MSFSSLKTKHKNRQVGVGLVEVLVALVVMTIGMLGMASLYVTTLQAKITSGSRMRATNLAYDMADRIRANPLAGDSYVVTPSTKIASASCATKTCDPDGMAKADLYSWNQLLTSSTSGLPGATRQIDHTVGTANVPDIFQISLGWTEPNSSMTLSYVVQVEICNKAVTATCP